MENWGLVTYRTAALLYDPEKSSEKIKQRIASVVAHELAHQWFGNLVTMEWWSDLWLNEGFATWVGNYAVNKIFPEWDFWTQFVGDDYQRALSLDAMKSSHPIEVEVKRPEEISQIFDAISYSKGASVIRMLSSHLGEKTFLEGIAKYLQKYKYSNASTMDLWVAILEHTGKDVPKFMNIWTKQMGYPVITIKESIDGDKAVLNLSQVRYLSSGESDDADKDLKWWVPLSYISSKSFKEPVNQILTDKEDTITIDGASSDTFFYKFNYLLTGIYRTNYPVEMLKRLGSLIQKQLEKNQDLSKLSLEDETFFASDRIGIVSDAAALAKSGHSSASNFLEIARHFDSETHYGVWSEIVSRLSSLITLLSDQPDDIVKKIRKFRLELISKILPKLGWEKSSNEDPLRSLLRVLITSAAGNDGHPDTLKTARDLFAKLISGDENAIQPDLRGIVFSMLLKHAGKDETDPMTAEQYYEVIKKIYLKSTLPDQKNFALAALGASTDPKVIQKALDFAVSGDVRNQDIIYIMSALGSNEKARKSTWDFVKSHWDLFESKYSTNLSFLGYIVKYTTSDMTTEEDAQDVLKFFEGRGEACTKLIRRPLDQSIEGIRSNVEWLKRDLTNIVAWLNENVN